MKDEPLYAGTLCPSCGEQAISLLRKLSMGPAIPSTCGACGAKVGVAYSTLLFPVLPWMLLNVALTLLAMHPDVLALVPSSVLVVPPKLALLLTLSLPPWVALAAWWVLKIPLIEK